MTYALGIADESRAFYGALEPLRFVEMPSLSARLEVNYSARVIVMRLSGWGTLAAARGLEREIASLPRIVRFPRVLVTTDSLTRFNPRADARIGWQLRQLFPDVDRVAVAGFFWLHPLLNWTYRRVMTPGPIRNFAYPEAALAWLLA